MGYYVFIETHSLQISQRTLLPTDIITVTSIHPTIDIHSSHRYIVKAHYVFFHLTMSTKLYRIGRLGDLNPLKTTGLLTDFQTLRGFVRPAINI